MEAREQKLTTSEDATLMLEERTVKGPLVDVGRSDSANLDR